MGSQAIDQFIISATTILGTRPVLSRLFGCWADSVARLSCSTKELNAYVGPAVQCAPFYNIFYCLPYLVEQHVIFHLAQQTSFPRKYKKKLKNGIRKV